jgi:hypothetical protein
MEVTVYLEVGMKRDYQGQVGMKSGVCVYYKFPQFKSKHSLYYICIAWKKDHSRFFKTRNSIPAVRESKLSTLNWPMWWNPYDVTSKRDNSYLPKGRLLIMKYTHWV